MANRSARKKAISIAIRSASLATFARRGRRLSKEHRRKISESLKQKKGNRQERSLAIRESEARTRSLRNIGYLANSASDVVREARMTARFLGIDPSRRRSSRRFGLVQALAGTDLNTGRAARSVRNLRYLGLLR